MRLAVLASHPVQYYAPLFRTLAERVDLHVFFAHKATPAQQAAAGFGTAFDWDIDLLSGYAHSFLTNVAREPSAARFSGCDTPEVGARLREGRFDAVLSLGWHLKALVQGIWAAKRAGMRVLVRGDSQLETPRSRLKRWGKDLAYPSLLRAFDAALYVGMRSRAYYAHYRYPADRLFFSPHCVETERFAAGATGAARRQLRGQLGLSEDAPAALFAGKLVPFKRPLDLIESAAQVRAGGLPLSVLVAGAGELEAPMRARAAELDVPIHMLGFCNQSAMPAVYAASDLLVLPSTGRETWGLVANEALASGRPIVVSDQCGCAQDLAGDGQAGAVYPMGDTAALASTIRRAIAARPAPESIRRVSDRHSLAAAAEGVMAALDATARRASSAA